LSPEQVAKENHLIVLIISSEICLKPTNKAAVLIQIRVVPPSPKYRTLW